MHAIILEQLYFKCYLHFYAFIYFYVFWKCGLGQMSLLSLFKIFISLKLSFNYSFDNIIVLFCFGMQHIRFTLSALICNCFCGAYWSVSFMIQMLLWESRRNSDTWDSPNKLSTHFTSTNQITGRSITVVHCFLQLETD